MAGEAPNGFEASTGVPSSGVGSTTAASGAFPYATGVATAYTCLVHCAFAAGSPFPASHTSEPCLLLQFPSDDAGSTSPTAEHS